jgi:hypothetical protein
LEDEVELFELGWLSGEAVEVVDDYGVDIAVPNVVGHPLAVGSVLAGKGRNSVVDVLVINGPTKVGGKSEAVLWARRSDEWCGDFWGNGISPSDPVHRPS